MASYITMCVCGGGVFNYCQTTIIYRQKVGTGNIFEMQNGQVSNVQKGGPSKKTPL